MNNLHELQVAVAVKGILAAVWGFMLQLTGYPETAFSSLICLMLFDLALGLVRAWKQKNFCGKKLVKGAFKFLQYVIAVAIFYQADLTLDKAEIGFDINLTNYFIAYLALNELGSCMEHLAFLGIPMPEAIKERLRKYREALNSGNA
jgi:toxin secretion/phage lysis holin